MIALALTLALSTYEVRIYLPGQTAIVASRPLTPTCGAITVPVTAGEMINPTRLVWDEPGQSCTVPAVELITGLPKVSTGTIYEGSVVVCDGDKGCTETVRTTFCVGVPTQYQAQPTCEAALKASKDTGALYWFFCVLLRLCK